MFKKLRMSGYWRALLLALCGVWFIWAPYSVYGSVKLVLVGWLLVMGIPAIIDGLVNPNRTGFNSALWRGVGYLIAAMLVALFLRPVVTMLPVMFGLLLIVYGINRISIARRDRQYVNVSPLPSIIYGALIVIAGIILLFNAFSSMMLMLQVLGCIFVVMGIIELVDTIRESR